MKSNLKLSIVASASLLSVALLTGCGSSSSTPAAYDVSVSGKAIDGYISGATVSYADTNTTTTQDGNWTVAIPNTLFGGNSMISVTGGTDTVTGEAFEGTMSVVVPSTSSDQTSDPITPLSTIIASAVTAGKTPAQAKADIAAALGLNVADLAADPVADINSTASQATLKAILQVQKLVEVMSDINSSDTGISNLVFADIAAKLQVADANLSTALTAVIDNVTVLTGVSQSDLNNTKDALNIVKNQLEDINASTLVDLSSLTSVAKAVEVVTTDIENKFQDGNISQALKIAKTVAIKGINKIRTDVISLGDNADISTYSESTFDATTIAAAVSLYTLLETFADADVNTSIEEIISSIAKTDGNISSAIDAVADINSSQLSSIDSNATAFTAAADNAVATAATAATAAGYQDFALAGQDTNVTKSGEFAAINVSDLLNNFSVTYPTFAERVEDNTTDATFAMKITNADSQKVILKVSGVDITKNSDTNISVEADTAASLAVSYTQGADMATLESTNLTTDTFDTNSTGAMTIDLSTKLDTIMANSTYSDFNDSINNYFTGSGVYSIQACISTNVELKDNDFYQIMTIGEDSMKCVDGNVTINY